MLEILNFRMLTEQDHQLDCALDLMRRLPPHHVERNLSNLIDIVPDLCEDLLSSVDQPLKIQKDKEVCLHLLGFLNNKIVIDWQRLFTL